METHNMALTALTEGRAHKDECARRYEDWKDANAITQKIIETIRSKVGNLEVKIAVVVGVVMFAREIIVQGLQLAHH